MLFFGTQGDRQCFLSEILNFSTHEAVLLLNICFL